MTANIKNRVAKLETQESPDAKVHVIINDLGNEEASIDRHGREKIGSRDLVVVVNRLSDRAKD